MHVHDLTDVGIYGKSIHMMQCKQADNTQLPFSTPQASSAPSLPDGNAYHRFFPERSGRMQWSWPLLRYILPGIPGRILLTPLPLPDSAPLQSESVVSTPADEFFALRYFRQMVRYITDTLDIVLLRYQKRNDHFPEILS